MEQERLGRSEWLRAARAALLHGGPDAVRVETLARTLEVTKGSFYWHFKDRDELLEELLREWESEAGFVRDLTGRDDFDAALSELFQELHRRVVASEKGEWPSDAAIFGWAAVSPAVARRANREEKRRIKLLEQFLGDPLLAEYIYLAYLGFILRRRRDPAAAKRFPNFAAMTTELIASRRRKARR